jgi:hypothetical protein
MGKSEEEALVILQNILDAGGRVQLDKPAYGYQLTVWLDKNDWNHSHYEDANSLVAAIMKAAKQIQKGQ